MIRLDPAGKAAIERAAEHRHLSTSNCVRTAVVAQANKDLTRLKTTPSP